MNDILNKRPLYHPSEGGSGDRNSLHGFLIGNGRGKYTSLKTNFNASAAPTVNDDSSDGYTVGSSWYDLVADIRWDCLDATPGAAVWKTTTASGEINTASNLGSGAELFAGKVTYDLQFRSLVAGSDKVIITESATEIEIDVAPGFLVLGDLDGTLGETQGGTGQTAFAKGDMLVATDTDVLGVLAPNATSTKTFVTMTSSVASHSLIEEDDLPSHTHSSSDIIGSGTPFGVAVGGTGIASYTKGDVIVATSALVLGKLAGNYDTTPKFLVSTGTGSGTNDSTQFRTITNDDLPLFGASGSGHKRGAVPDPGASVGTTKYLCEDGTWAIPTGSGTGTVESVGLTAPAQFSVSGSPVTVTGDLALSWVSQTNNLVFAGPSAAPGVPTFRALVAADIPNITASKVSDFSEAVDDRVAALLIGSGVTVGYDDALNTLTLTVAASSHELLSATHTDTTTATVVRGDLITGQGGTPKWTRLAKGSANTTLISDGTDLAWGQLSLTAGVTGILPVANGGTGANTFTSNLVLLGSGTSAITTVASIGSSGQVLTSNGAGLAPTWQAAASGLPDFFLEASGSPVNALTASSTSAVAIGDGATAMTSSRAIAIGNSRATGTDSLAAQIGSNTSTYGAQNTNAIALGFQAKASALRSFVGGGNTNTASGADSAVVGGASNTASQTRSACLAGETNLASGFNSAVIGGNNNGAAGNDSVVIGGSTNEADVTSTGTSSVVVAGGTVSGSRSVAITSTTSTVAADYGIAIACKETTNNWTRCITIGPNGTDAVNNSAFASALTTWANTGPAIICGAGSGNSAGLRANSFVFTYNGRLILGGQGKTSEAAGFTGSLELGTPSSVFSAQIQSAAQAATRIYTVPDAGAAANFIMSTSGSGQSIAGKFRLTSPTVPTLASDAGTAGEIAWDSGFIYICTATNTWKRVAIATF